MPLRLEILRAVQSEIPSAPFAWHGQSYEMIPPRVSLTVSAWLPWALKTRDPTVQKVGQRIGMCLKVPAWVLWFVCGMSPLGLQMVVLFGKVEETFRWWRKWVMGGGFMLSQSQSHFRSADCERSNACRSFRAATDPTPSNWAQVSPASHKWLLSAISSQPWEKWLIQAENTRSALLSSVCVGCPPYLHKAHSVYELETKERPESGEDKVCVFLLEFSAVSTVYLQGTAWPACSISPKVAAFFQGRNNHARDSHERATCKALETACVSPERATQPSQTWIRTWHSWGEKVAKGALKGPTPEELGSKALLAE